MHLFLFIPRCDTPFGSQGKVRKVARHQGAGKISSTSLATCPPLIKYRTLVLASSLFHSKYNASPEKGLYVCNLHYPSLRLHLPRVTSAHIQAHQENKPHMESLKGSERLPESDDATAPLFKVTVNNLEGSSPSTPQLLAL